MMSTVFPSESLPSYGNNKPLFAFSGDFTPWENLESFFTSIDHKHNDQNNPKSKPNLGCYHAEFGLGSEGANLSRYHDGFGLDFESQNKESPCFDESNLSCYHAFSKTDKAQKLLSPNGPILDHYHTGSDLSSDSPNQKSPPTDEMSPDDSHPNSKPTFSSSSSGSDDSSQIQIGSNSNSCHDEKIITEERKRKRKISNRESAKRSRMRKQRHLETLRNSANELKIQTRERSNNLRLITHQIQLKTKENNQLKVESIILQRRLIQLSQIWQLQQVQQQCSYRSHQHSSPSQAPSCVPMQIINRLDNEHI